GRRRSAAGRLARRASALLPGDQRSRGVRCGRRAVSIGQAGGLCGRRGGDGGHARPPLPGAPVSTAPMELREELRGNFLFESLTDEQLDWLVAHGTVETHEAGVNVYDQDEAAESFYVLLEGEIQLVKRLDGTDVVLTTSD